jgi:hypothetical protein
VKWPGDLARTFGLATPRVPGWPPGCQSDSSVLTRTPSVIALPADFGSATIVQDVAANAAALVTCQLTFPRTFLDDAIEVPHLGTPSVVDENEIADLHLVAFDLSKQATSLENVVAANVLHAESPLWQKAGLGELRQEDRQAGQEPEDEASSSHRKPPINAAFRSSPTPQGFRNSNASK